MFKYQCSNINVQIPINYSCTERPLKQQRNSYKEQFKDLNFEFWGGEIKA
jgi:hypothetical protein